MTGAVLGLVRVIASLLSESRPDSEAQRPLADGDTATAAAPSELPAPAGPPCNVAATEDVGRVTQPAGTAFAAVGATEGLGVSAAAASAGKQPAADNTVSQQAPRPQLGQAAAALGAGFHPLDAPHPVDSADSGMRPAEPPDATAPSAGEAADSHPRDAAGMAASAARMPSVAAEAVGEARQPLQQEQPPSASGEAVAPQLVKVEVPETDAPASLSADPATPVPKAPAVPQAGPHTAANQQAVAVAPVEPPRPQPPPPPQLLLLSEDASGEEVQAAALGTFRELYPIFEPFQARCSQTKRHRTALPSLVPAVKARQATDINGVMQCLWCCAHKQQVTSMEGLAEQLRYPLRALFADASVTLHGDWCRHGWTLAQCRRAPLPVAPRSGSAGCAA